MEAYLEAYQIKNEIINYLMHLPDEYWLSIWKRASETIVMEDIRRKLTQG